MKQITIGALRIALALGAMASVASAANDRYYNATISPNNVASGATTTFNLTLLNNIKSGPSHFLRQIIVTVPTGFTITGAVTVLAPQTAPLPWKATVSGQTITVVSGSSSDASVTAGQSVTIVVPAKAPTIANCASPASYTWNISANQVVGGGQGNSYLLTPGTTNPSVKVSCDTQTNLDLSIDPTGLSTTDTGTLLTLTAKLTKTAGSTAIDGEPVTFTVGGAPVTCISPSSATTDASGIAICSYYPLPNPLLVPNPYECLASFAGDGAKGLGSSNSSPVTLNINATGTGIQVTDAAGPFGGTVTLTATLAANGLGLSNKEIKFSLNGTVVNPSATTDANGVATLNNVSLGTIPTGFYGQGINASFAGDATYDKVSGTSKLTVGGAVTVTLTADNKIYDTTTAATISNCVVNGLQGADVNTVTCNVTDAKFAAPDVGNNLTVTASGIYLSGSNSQNYTLSSTSATTTANITPASSYVVVTGGSFGYNGSAHPAIGTAFTAVGSLTNPNAVTITYSGSCGAVAPTTVAEGTNCLATGTYGGDANHTGNTGSASVTITPASSFVTVTGGSFPYDGNPHPATSAVAGTLYGSLTNPNAVTITYSGSCGAVAPTTVAEGTTCLATGTYGGDANHAGSTGSASVTITPGSNPITFTSMIVTATAPGGTVTFNLGAQTYCTVAEAKDASNSPIPGAALVTLTSGTWAQCNVLANQSGGGNYGSATQEAVGLSVTP